MRLRFAGEPPIDDARADRSRRLPSVQLLALRPCAHVPTGECDGQQVRECVWSASERRDAQLHQFGREFADVAIAGHRHEQQRHPLVEHDPPPRVAQLRRLDRRDEPVALDRMDDEPAGLVLGREQAEGGPAQML